MNLLTKPAAKGPQIHTMTPRTEVTTNYDKFSYILANRETNRTHIANLKAAISEHPEILEAQPLLVNEKYQIIDGQHRFRAAAELGLPIHYTIVPGIGIETARSMNILQRRWEPSDFANSYAVTGNKHYQAYLTAIEDFGLPHNVTLSALSGIRAHGQNAKFRRGEFEVADLQVGREYLDHIIDVKNIISGLNVGVPMISPFMFALLQVFKHPDFKYDRFIEKLQSNGAGYLRRSPITEDYLRMIEEIFNVGNHKRIRLW